MTKEKQHVDIYSLLYVQNNEMVGMHLILPKIPNPSFDGKKFISNDFPHNLIGSCN